MIARLWRGVVAADRAADYAQYVHATGGAEYRQAAGNRGSYIFTRDLGDGTAELLAVSVWQDWADVRRFAGDDGDAMVLYPEDSAYLVVEPSLAHYDVVEPKVDAAKEQAVSATDMRVAAEAFSAHRFADAYPFLAPHVTWNVIGGESREGRDAVVAVCEGTLAELVDTRTDFLRFVSAADDGRVAVDTVARYTGADGSISVVASCDFYEFRDGVMATITSYYGELPAA